MTAYFVTGTDTGVGKTVVAAALLAAARRRGLATLALKPAETGCRRDDRGRLWPADAAFLHAACAQKGDPRQTCLHAYETPAAPAVASRIEGSPVRVESLPLAVDNLLARRPDLFLVEGAGGLLVPFTETHTAADIAAALSLPLLIVARAGLGTINHCALTVECARNRGLPIRGIIFSDAGTDPSDPTIASNAAEVARLTGIPILGELPRLSSLDPHELARAAESHLALDAILRGR